MKAILMIDMPKYCRECPLHRFMLDEVLNEWFVNCQLNIFIDEDERRPSQCPLRPLPQEKKLGDIDEIIWDDDIYALGFNRCLHEITGETE